MDKQQDKKLMKKLKDNGRDDILKSINDKKLSKTIQK